MTNKKAIKKLQKLMEQCCAQDRAVKEAKQIHLDLKGEIFDMLAGKFPVFFQGVKSGMSGMDSYEDCAGLLIAVYGELNGKNGKSGRDA